MPEKEGGNFKNPDNPMKKWTVIFLEIIALVGIGKLPVPLAEA